MSYIGNSASNQTFTPVIDTFNGNGSTTAFTLTYPVASVAQVEAYISNVPQQPGVAYTVLGNTITFTSAPPSGTANIYVRYTSPITQIMQPGQGTVGTPQMMDAAVTAAKIASGQVLPAAGIAFPATQLASSNANTLDDYEEGTWTPIFSNSSSQDVASAYTARTGKYIKIGQQVIVWFYVRTNITSWAWINGADNSTQIFISGLPFATSALAAYPAFYTGWWYNLPTSPGITTGYINPTDSKIVLQKSGGSLASIVTGADINSVGSSIIMTGSYFTAN